MYLSDEFKLKFPELSQAEREDFNFRAETELTKRPYFIQIFISKANPW